MLIPVKKICQSICWECIRQRVEFSGGLPQLISLTLSIPQKQGRNVDGRDIVVQFAKYGPNAEAIYKGRLTSEPPYSRGKYRRSHSPRHSSRRDHDDYRHRDYRRQSRSRDRHERYRYSEREREYRRRTPSRSISPTFSRSRSRSRIVVNDEQIKRSCSRSLDSGSPVRRSPSPPSRIPTPKPQSPNQSSPSLARSPAPASSSPNAQRQSPQPSNVSPCDAALVGVIPMESQMCLQFQYQCFVFWCWTYSMFKQFNCWMRFLGILQKMLTVMWGGGNTTGSCGGHDDGLGTCVLRCWCLLDPDLSISYTLTRSF
eukprot:Gb_38561 [translate_table: standard]